MPHTATTGEEGDISTFSQYKWYDWCYFREHTGKFPYNQEVLGHVLGPARGKGNEMAQWVLKANGNVVPRCCLQVSEIHSLSKVQEQETFDHLIKRRWCTLINPPKEPIKTNNYGNDCSGDEDDIVRSGDEDDSIKPQPPSPDIEDSVNHNRQLLHQHPAYDRI